MRWEQGRSKPDSSRILDIARALGVAPGALFCDDNQCFVGEVILSPESVAEIRAEGAPAAHRIAARLARRLEPLLLEAAQPPKPWSPTAKPRRTRAQVLADQNARLDALHKRTQPARRLRQAGGEGPDQK